MTPLERVREYLAYKQDPMSYELEDNDRHFTCRFRTSDIAAMLREIEAGRELREAIRKWQVDPNYGGPELHEALCTYDATTGEPHA